MTGIYKRFTEDKRGNVAITGTLLILPILMLAGVGIDYSRISNAEKTLESVVDNAAADAQRLFRLGPYAEKELEDLINANTGRDTARVKISINQDKLRIDATDEIDTPLLSTIGQAKSEITASIEVDGNRQTSVGSEKASTEGSRTDQQKAAETSKKRQSLRRLERNLEESLRQVRMSSRINYRLRQRIEDDLRKQLRIVRDRIRSL